VGIPRDDRVARGLELEALEGVAVLRTTYVSPQGGEVTLEVEEGTSVMRAAVLAGVQGIVGECGGQAMCATCHVYVRPEWSEQLPAISDNEEEMLESTAAERTERSRLSCQITAPAEDAVIVVDLPDRQN
jgi:2Fe-2S ferredoxin